MTILIDFKILWSLSNEPRKERTTVVAMKRDSGTRARRNSNWEESIVEYCNLFHAAMTRQ